MASDCRRYQRSDPICKHLVLLKAAHVSPLGASTRVGTLAQAPEAEPTKVYNYSIFIFLLFTFPPTPFQQWAFITLALQIYSLQQSDLLARAKHLITFSSLSMPTGKLSLWTTSSWCRKLIFSHL